MAGKILFVDDEHTNEGGLIQIALNTLKQKVDFKEVCDNVEYANGFADAVEKIINAGDGAGYSWFFLDRNLESFSDVKNGEKKTVKLPGGDQIVFSDVFFQCFKKFEGDYLYFLLRKAGVPIEKICFLTGNDPNNSGEGSLLQSTPFVFGEKTPEVIVKLKPDPNQAAMSFVNDDSVKIENPLTADVAALVEKIGKTLQVQLRCRYSEIFKDEEKLDDIIGKGNSNEFLRVLEKIESKKSCPEKKDGTVFRIMVEKICVWLKKGGSIEPRTLLNNIGQNQAYCLNFKNFEYALSKTFELKKKGFDMNDLCELKSWLLNNNTQIKSSKVQRFINKLSAKNFADRLDTGVFLCFLNYYLQNGSGIPKYILACLDHVYTLTSEFSAHGKRDIKEADIPWRALADDMITILKWCVANNPPQYNEIEVTLLFDASNWPSNRYKINNEVTLKKLHQSSQNPHFPQGKIIKIESV